MIKYTFLLLSTVAVLSSKFYGVDDVVVTQNIPETVEANADFTVEITLKKGDINGFAKLEQDLPDGFTALPIDMKGGSFTFERQKIKIIWFSIPTSNEFEISYSLKVAPQAKGKKIIGGKVYFLKDNQRQSTDIVPSSITIK